MQEDHQKGSEAKEKGHKKPKSKMDKKSFSKTIFFSKAKQGKGRPRERYNEMQEDNQKDSEAKEKGPRKNKNKKGPKKSLKKQSFF